MNNFVMGPMGPQGPNGPSPQGPTGGAGNTGDAGASGTVVTVNVTLPLIIDFTSAAIMNLSLATATTLASGFVTSSNWQTFNAKQAAAYTPNNPAYWSGSPTTFQEAVDRIAAALSPAP